jgi:hypothetical protein
MNDSSGTPVILMCTCMAVSLGHHAVLVAERETEQAGYIIN